MIWISIVIIAIMTLFAIVDLAFLTLPFSMIVSKLVSGIFAVLFAYLFLRIIKNHKKTINN